MLFLAGATTLLTGTPDAKSTNNTRQMTAGCDLASAVPISDKTKLHVVYGDCPGNTPLRYFYAELKLGDEYTTNANTETRSRNGDPLGIRACEPNITNNYVAVCTAVLSARYYFVALLTDKSDSFDLVVSIRRHRGKKLIRGSCRIKDAPVVPRLSWQIVSGSACGLPGGGAQQFFKFDLTRPGTIAIEWKYVSYGSNSVQARGSSSTLPYGCATGRSGSGCILPPGTNDFTLQSARPVPSEVVIDPRPSRYVMRATRPGRFIFVTSESLWFRVRDVRSP